MNTFHIVWIANKWDKDAQKYIDENRKLGFIVYEVKNSYYVTILNDMIWRAEDAQFKSVPDGTYVFRGETVYLVQ